MRFLPIFLETASFLAVAVQSRQRPQGKRIELKNAPGRLADFLGWTKSRCAAAALYSGRDMIFGCLARGKQSCRFNCRGFRSTQTHSPFCKMKRGTALSASMVG
jgi:hypothetical protein